MRRRNNIYALMSPVRPKLGVVCSITKTRLRGEKTSCHMLRCLGLVRRREKLSDVTASWVCGGGEKLSHVTASWVRETAFTSNGVLGMGGEGKSYHM